jgi:hypothetical protein
VTWAFKTWKSPLLLSSSSSSPRSPPMHTRHCLYKQLPYIS